jgi:CubicO group peptidase (beta-lactamase class C family)
MSYPAWWDRVIRLINGQVNAQNFPGAVFAAETRTDGKLIRSVGQGWSENTICEIGSMSKVFTATATLLALEEKGLLNLDAFVHTLPGMDIWHNLPAADRRKQIKIKHLLQHTSGLPWF